jgi:hypothetical protein
MTDVVRPTPAPFPWAEPFFTVGVTGTNGKTSTTYLTAAAFRAAGHSVITETTIGYELDGEVLPVQRTTEGYLRAFHTAAERRSRHGVVEVTSQALASGYAKMWRFDLGVFTNLSRDHLDVHPSWEHYLASKAQLFVHLAPGRTAVLNAADEPALLIDQVIPADVNRLWYAVPTRGPKLRAADLAAKHVSYRAPEPASSSNPPSSRSGSAPSSRRRSWATSSRRTRSPPPARASPRGSTRLPYAPASRTARSFRAVSKCSATIPSSRSTTRTHQTRWRAPATPRALWRARAASRSCSARVASGIAESASPWVASWASAWTARS